MFGHIDTLHLDDVLELGDISLLLLVAGVLGDIGNAGRQSKWHSSHKGSSSKE
jgi:hypothetical protein